MSSNSKIAEQRLSRIPLLSATTLNARQREIYEKVVAGPRGAVVGPLRAALHSPELAERWSSLGEFVRYQTSLNTRTSELAIVVVGRFWNSEVEWFIHAEIARRAGLPGEIIEAIRLASSPVFNDPVEAAVYDYTRELVEFGRVTSGTYQRTYRLLGTVALVELTALVGYYTMVAMTLNAHQIPVPAGDGSRLPEADQEEDFLQRPTALPAATLVAAAVPATADNR